MTKKKTYRRHSALFLARANIFGGVSVTSSVKDSADSSSCVFKPSVLSPTVSDRARRAAGRKRISSRNTNENDGMTRSCADLSRFSVENENVLETPKKIDVAGIFSYNLHHHKRSSISAEPIENPRKLEPLYDAITTSPLFSSMGSPREQCVSYLTLGDLRGSTETKPDCQSESIFGQIAFSGKTSCPKFEPQIYVKTRCANCGYPIEQHKKAAVSEKDIREAMEESGAPSLILPASNISGEKICHRWPWDNNAKPSYSVLRPENYGRGALYLSGVKILRSEKWLKCHGIRRVVTAATGIDRQFRYLPRARRRASALGVEFMKLQWFDSEEQKITEKELKIAVNFIDGAIRNGDSALVHCAAGVSRSTTVVAAYLCSLARWTVSKGAEKSLKIVYGASGEMLFDPSHCYVAASLPHRTKTVDSALRFIRKKRRRADPNRSFRRQLKELEKRRAFDEMLDVPGPS
eukprot:g765.t1